VTENPNDRDKLLDGQVAVVSGGLGAIGSATVRALAAHGADVAWCDLLPDDRALSLVGQVQDLGRRGLYHRVDVADARAVSSWLGEVAQTLGPPTLVIPNAAIVGIAPWLELPVEDWRRVLAVNLDGAFHMASFATREMVKRRLTGRVVFVGSWAAEHVHLQLPAYCVAKAGLRMLTRCMAGALAPHGILVNEISPGFVTAGLADQFPDASKDSHAASRRQVPIGRMIEPDEVASQIVHLCDPANRHMTGSTVLMDGGLSLFGTAVLDDRA
jgi:NAD(P)-dependent dehydrogenase (short-subunit alcohol dehydrogenase family)